MSSDRVPHLTSEVHFTPPPEWVTMRELDLAFHSPEGSSESVLLMDHQHHACEHACFSRMARRVEVMSSVQEAAQWRCDFDPATQRLVIHSLAVCRDGERMEQAEASRIRLLQREENLERFILDGSRTAIFLFSDVRIGDVLDVSYTIYSKPRILPEYYSHFCAVPVRSHVRMFSVSVRFSASKPMVWKTDSSKIQLQERELPGDEREWTWQVERFAPREPEAQMPPWFFQGRIIQFSNIPDWATVSRGLHAAWMEDFEHRELTGVVNQVMTRRSMDERVEAALRLVQDDIRYLSVNTELGGHIPANPGEVLARRFGDCKDKAFLAAHLLRCIGVPARPVLVHSFFQKKVQEFLPSIAVFNHAIVEFEMEDGVRRWVDATIPVQGGGPKGRYLPQFGAGLPVGLDVKEVEELAKQSGIESHYGLREHLRIEKKNALFVTIVREVTGMYADEARHHEAHLGSIAAARQREERFKSIFPNAKRHEEAIISDNREKNHYAIAESYLIPDAIVPTGEPGVAGFRFPVHLIQSAVAFPKIEKRKYPLALPYPCSIEQKLECDFRVLGTRGTEVVKFGGEHFHLNVKVNSHPSKLVWSFEYKSYADHVPVNGIAKHCRKVAETWPGLLLTILVPSEGRSAGPRRSLDDQLPSNARPAAIAQEAVLENAAGEKPQRAPALSSRSVPSRSTEARDESRPESPQRVSRTQRSRMRGTRLSSEYRARNIGIGAFLLILIVRLILMVIWASR